MVKRSGQLGYDAILAAVDWHPRQHVFALGSYGDGSPVILYEGGGGGGVSVL